MYCRCKKVAGLGHKLYEGVWQGGAAGDHGGNWLLGLGEFNSRGVAGRSCRRPWGELVVRVR